MNVLRTIFTISAAIAIANSTPVSAKAGAVWKPVNGSTLGGPVSEKLRGKPLVIRIHAAWCAECQTTLPDYLRFTKAYQGKINTIDIDVTDGKTSAAAAALARSVGLAAYYEKTKTAPLTVAFIDPNSTKLIAELRGNVDYSDLARAERSVERSLRSR